MRFDMSAAKLATRDLDYATNGRPCFAFRTSDNSGPYQTSGCLVGERIKGQTWSEGRNFVLAWTAVRTAKGQ